MTGRALSSPKPRFTRATDGRLVQINSLGQRLRDERKRVGHSQRSLAPAIGASLRAVQDWEKGLSSPNAKYLIAMSLLGIDVLYVLLGRHESTPPAAEAATPEAR